MTPLLALTAITKSFGGVKAVSNVSLSLGSHDMLAVIGPNGCGKTTLFNLITGMLVPDAGDILFDGKRINGMALHHVARRGILRKFQVPSIFPGLTVAENLMSAAGTSSASLDALMHDINLEGLADLQAAALSHGQKQWLELGLCLAARPRLLLLDEPAAGMTKAEKLATVALVKRLQKRDGLAAILIEHDMDFVEALECPVAVMMEGQIIITGAFEHIRRDQRVMDAYLGRVHA
jgi:ABC-type branched-subunit amino acid transport system ATPase component